VTGGRMPFCLIALAVTPLVHGVTMADAPPNVALIVCDDQAWFHFCLMGNREIQTPNLDSLAEQSALFTRGYVPTSVCRPSPATMITGRYPHVHRLCYRGSRSFRPIRPYRSWSSRAISSRH
jgi:uncharacterized sulfatase